MGVEWGGGGGGLGGVAGGGGGGRTRPIGDPGSELRLYRGGECARYIALPAGVL